LEELNVDEKVDPPITFVFLKIIVAFTCAIRVTHTKGIGGFANAIIQSTDLLSDTITSIRKQSK
jgi:hypothetical protein